MAISAMNPLLGTGIIRLLGILAMFWVISATTSGISSVGLQRSGLLQGLQRGMVWFAVCGVICSMGFVLVSICGHDPFKFIHVDLPTRGSQLVQYYIVAGVVAAVGEEIFFRGLVYGFFRRWGKTVAISMSSLLFMAAHAPTVAVPVTQLVGGIVFAVAFETERNLLVPILIHGLGNTTIFTLSLLL